MAQTKAGCPHISARRRLYDLAEMSREKALELAKPNLIDEAEMYERDAVFLATLRD